jgi:excinuclease ABC subunit C
MQLPEKVTRKLRDIPDKPGCYMMRDRRGRIIYVGKAISLRKRVLGYFRKSTLRNADPKLRGMLKSVEDLDYIVVRNDAEAVLTEGQLIKDFKPRYNVSFRDDKRFLLLRVDTTQPLPRFQVCRFKRSDAATHFGPYASSGAARGTLDFVEKRFGLRKCRPRVPTEEDYRHCINDVVRFCSAPCTGKVSPEEYRERVEEACSFLRGEKPEYLKELRAEMDTAAEKRNFERAAVLRDTLFSLQQSIKQSARMVSTPDMKARDARSGIESIATALGLSEPPHVIEGFDISNISGTFAVASMVCAVKGLPQRNRYRRFRIKTVSGIDDPRMIGEVIMRRFARLKSEKKDLPDLVLIDGGITQLRAGRAALKSLGLEAIPSIGLAKRYEEVYWKDGAPTIRFDRDSPALKVLQALRDEAHRFALTYHRHLRNKKIKESALDEIPGVGKKRKIQILQHFGSIQRLMKAELEDIEHVPGVGSETAMLVHEEMRRLKGGRS